MIRYFYIQEISKEEYYQKAKETKEDAPFSIEGSRGIDREYEDLGEGNFILATRDGQINIDLEEDEDTDEEDD